MSLPPVGKRSGLFKRTLDEKSGNWSKPERVSQPTRSSFQNTTINLGQGKVKTVPKEQVKQLPEELPKPQPKTHHVRNNRTGFRSPVKLRNPRQYNYHGPSETVGSKKKKGLFWF